MIPTPITFARYWHRNLNPKKLVECEFSFKPADQAMSRFVKLHRLPDEPCLPGIKQMEPADVPAVTAALNAHLFANYKVHISFTEDEVAHFMLPQHDVVYSYVIKDYKTGKVTDFTSFYSLPSHVLNHPEHKRINAAYGFYSFVSSGDAARFNALMKDALIFARKEKFDVFNVTEVMMHRHGLEKNMFKMGDGNLAHYLYNWRINTVKAEDVGIILV